MEEQSITVEIVSKGDLDELKRSLEEELGSEAPSIQLEFGRTADGKRDGGITLLAIIYGAAKISPLVFGLIQLLKKRKSDGKIIFHMKDRSKLEVPADTSHERIEELLKTHRQLNDLQKIVTD